MSAYRQLKLSVYIQSSTMGPMSFYDYCLWDRYDYGGDGYGNWMPITDPSQLCIVREWYREYLQNLAYATGLFQFMGINSNNCHLNVLYNGFLTPFVYNLIQWPAPCAYSLPLYLYGGYYNVCSEIDGGGCHSAEEETKEKTIAVTATTTTNKVERRAAIMQKPYSRHNKKTK